MIVGIFIMVVGIVLFVVGATFGLWRFNHCGCTLS